ncbi:hypothetical protein SBRCBS47491_010103 [Sporothrix bragantina]|uniref:AB hydrolase-1 domain-containing protein n=1 Tax=Sporothrix bragantina TaxID=671064 RepID=A0ABP0CZZ6_9PEZI
MGERYGSFSLPDDRAISYDLTPTDQDTPVILLSNSLCGQFRSWDKVVAALSVRGFRVLRYDQPRHGASGVPKDLASTTFDSLADDAYALLQHLDLKTVAAWVGVSMGASTGITFAAKYPGIISQLVVCDTISCALTLAGAVDPFPPRVKAMRTAGNLDELVEGTMQRWFGKDWISAHPGEAARMRGIMLTGTTMDGFETCCAALSSPSYDLRKQVEAAGRGCRKALLLVGENDANLPTTMQELRRGLERGNGKSVELRVVANAGHVLFVDGFEDFMQLLLTFLQG